MKLALTFVLLLSFVFLNDHQVTGRCTGNSSVGNEANSSWLACLVAENNEKDGNCPHGFPKVENVYCGWGWEVKKGQKHYVCCVLAPVVSLKIKQSPCVAGSQPSNDKIEKKRHGHH